MDANRLSLGEKLLAASGLALLVLSFLSLWAKVEVEVRGDDDFGVEGTERFTAWSGYGLFVKLALVLALIAVVLVVARSAGANLNVPYASAYKGLATATLVLLVITFLVGPDESGSISNDFGSVEISRGLGLFIGVVLAAAMAAGAWLHSEPAAASPAAPA